MFVTLCISKFSCIVIYLFIEIFYLINCYVVSYIVYSSNVNLLMYTKYRQVHLLIKKIEIIKPFVKCVVSTDTHLFNTKIKEFKITIMIIY